MHTTLTCTSFHFKIEIVGSQSRWKVRCGRCEGTSRQGTVYNFPESGFILVSQAKTILGNQMPAGGGFVAGLLFGLRK